MFVVANDGGVQCNSLQTNTTDGLLAMMGLVETSQITSAENITTSGTLRINGINSTSTNATTLHDNATGLKLWNINNSGAAFYKPFSCTRGSLSTYNIGSSSLAIQVGQARTYL